MARRARVLSMASWASCLVMAPLAAPARADGPIGSNGTPITTSDYAIDLGAGPVVAGSRVTGLAGAYVAISEDVDGNPQNPASPAVRPGYSLEHFDYHLGLSLAFPAALGSSDFFNTGGETTMLTSRADSAAFITLAANFQWGTVGLGITADGQTYSLDKRPETDDDGPEIEGLQAVIGGARVQAANAFFDGQAIAGVGMRIIGLTVKPPGEDSLFDTRATGLEAGVLVRPNGAPFRVGAAFQAGVTTGVDPASQLQPNAVGDIIAMDDLGNAIYLPSAVKLPWRVDVGVAHQWGARPLNPRWIHPHRFDDPKREAMEKARQAREAVYRQRMAVLRSEGKDAEMRELRRELDEHEADDEAEMEAFEQETRRVLRELYVNLPRRYLLLSAQLHLRGAVSQAVGVESFLQGRVNRSGQQVTASPRIGIESEVLPNLLRLRAGTYYEPTRFRTSDGRLHGTLGFDVRLFRWDVFGIKADWYEWRAGGVIDLAARYLGWGLTVGGWY